MSDVAVCVCAFDWHAVLCCAVMCCLCEGTKATTINKFLRKKEKGK
jgi:hypothetical protein